MLDEYGQFAKMSGIAEEQRLEFDEENDDQTEQVLSRANGHLQPHNLDGEILSRLVLGMQHELPTHDEQLLGLLSAHISHILRDLELELSEVTEGRT